MVASVTLGQDIDLDEIVVTMPSITPSVLQEMCRATGAEFCTWNVLAYQITTKHLKPAFVNSQALSEI